MKQGCLSDVHAAKTQRRDDFDLAEKDPHDPIQIMLAWEVSIINDAWPRFVLTPHPGKGPTT